MLVSRRKIAAGRTYFLLELPLASQVGSFKDAVCAYLDAIYFLGYEAWWDGRDAAELYSAI